MRRFGIVSSCILLSACSTSIEGRHQEITVSTAPPGADCGLYRDGVRIATIQSTPDSALVDRTTHDIWVVCAKQGYQQAIYLNRSGITGNMFRSFIRGGEAGRTSDGATGSGNKYDGVVSVSLVPTQPGQADEPAVLPNTFDGPSIPATTASVPPQQANAAAPSGALVPSVDAPRQKVALTPSQGTPTAQSAVTAPTGFDGDWIVEMKLATSNYSGSLLSCPDRYEFPLQFANRSAEGPWGKLRFTSDDGDLSGWMQVPKTVGERPIILNLSGHMDHSQVIGTITGSCIGTFRTTRR